MMINDDQKYPIELMQSTSVNHKHIHFNLRCSFILNEKYQYYFPSIFSFTDSFNHISQSIFQQYITHLTNKSFNTLILLSGQYHEINQIQHTLLLLTIKHLFTHENLLLQLTINKYPLDITSNYLKTILSFNQNQSLAICISFRNCFNQLVQFHLITINEFPNLSILNEYPNDFLSILTTITNEKQLKICLKLQRKFSQQMTSSNEIWIDGPLCNSEIWIDGPRTQKSRVKIRSKPMHTKPKYPFRSTPTNFDDTNFDTESIVSSHCHLPVLPVFKDHSLLPFRDIQIKKPLSPKISRKSNTNSINDELEKLSKTIENLLIPSDFNITKSLNRMEKISSEMTNDEKSKRLSRIVSPTRFEKVLSNESKQSLPSVPNSPFINPKLRLSRASKKPQIPTRTSSLAESHSTRPSIIQRLFGHRSPPISPLTVTLDSHDDLMPMITSSTISSGRTSSSGYESMSNMIFDERIERLTPTQFCLRKKNHI